MRLSSSTPRISSISAQFVRDLALGFRALRRRPAFSLTAMVSLGVGIGANTTVFSVVDSLLFRPLPYPQPQRLVAIWPSQFLANREIAALRSRAKSYDQVTGFSPGWLMVLTGMQAPRQVDAARVSGNFFPMLGVAPLIGRAFGAEAETPGHDKAAVLSYGLWQSAFAGDPSIVGRSIRISRDAYTVVAVMPRSFSAFDVGSDLWTPLTMDPKELTWTGAASVAYGRLRPGVTPRQASAELGVLANAMRTEFQHAPDWTIGARVTGLQESVVGGVTGTLLVLSVAVAFLLLNAVVNVATLFLVRTAERRQELAVRTSFGATPLQIATLLLGESFALGALGGVIGIGLAYLGLGLLRRILPANLPRLSEIAVNGRVLVAAVAVTLVAAVVLGVAPSLQGLGAKLASRIRAGRTIAGGGGRTRGALIAVEVALALVLAVGAAVMSRTLVSLYRVDRGLRSDHLLTMRLEPSAPSDDASRGYWREVLTRVTSVPGVTSAATILHLPTSGRNWQADLEIEGRPLPPGESPPKAGWQSVSTGFFATAGMPVLRGRRFDESDGANAPLAVVLNSVLAERLFPGGNPVGQRIRAGFATSKKWATIVGVVSSVRHDSLNAPPGPELYVPFEQRVVGANSLVIRTVADPATLVGAIRERISPLDPNGPISDVHTMDDLYSGSLQRQRMILTLFSVFAVVGILLSAVGIYGVVAYSVRQRIREIGVRVALGADAGSIQRLVVSQGLRYGLAGVGIGVPIALALSGFMRGMVFGVPPTDPLSFAIVTLLLVLVAVLASWIPARAAARADPCEVLRDSLAR